MNVTTVDDLVSLLSQEGEKQTLRSTRQVSKLQRDGSNTV